MGRRNKNDRNNPKTGPSFEEDRWFFEALFSLDNVLSEF
jgi:hypothetical protein